MSENLSDIKDLVLKCWDISEEHGFHDDQTQQHPAIKLALIVSEIGEAVEAHRKGNHFINKECHFVKDALEDELIDSVIRIFDMWISLGHTPDEFEMWINEKMRYNNSREKMHGKNY